MIFTRRHVQLGYQGYKIKQPGYVDRESNIANCGNCRPASAGRDSTWAGGDAGKGGCGRETTSRLQAVQAPIGDVDLRLDCGLRNLCLCHSINKDFLSYFFENRSRVLQRTGKSSVQWSTFPSGPLNPERRASTCKKQHGTNLQPDPGQPN